MLKFAISLMRKMVPAAEANVPRAEIMAKLKSGNSCLRNMDRKLEKHLAARAKVLEAIDDLSDQDTPYVTSLQHVKLLNRLRRGDNLADQGKGLLNSDGTPETKMQAKMRRERERELPKVPLWHGNKVVIHTDLGKEKSAIKKFCRANRIEVLEHKDLPAGVRTK
ncbi:hypothetical protein ACFX12_023553 [Malus domestica]